MTISDKDKEILEAQLEYAYHTSQKFLASKRFYYHPSFPNIVSQIHDFSSKGLKALDEDKPTTASMHLREVILIAEQLEKAMKNVNHKTSAVWTEESIEKMRAFAKKCNEDKLDLVPERKKVLEDTEADYIPIDRNTPSP